MRVAHTLDLMTVTSYSVIQLAVSMTVTWTHHMFEHELHKVKILAPTVAILMTVTGISVANTFDLMTATSYSMNQLTVSIKACLEDPASRTLPRRV